MDFFLLHCNDDYFVLGDYLHATGLLQPIGRRHFRPTGRDQLYTQGLGCDCAVRYSSMGWPDGEDADHALSIPSNSAIRRGEREVDHEELRDGDRGLEPQDVAGMASQTDRHVMAGGGGGGESVQALQSLRQGAAQDHSLCDARLPGAEESGGGEPGPARLDEEARQSSTQPHGARAAGVLRRTPEISEQANTARRRGGKGGNKGKRGGRRNTVDLVEAELRRRGVERGSAQWNAFWSSERFWGMVLGRGG